MKISSRRDSRAISSGHPGRSAAGTPWATASKLVTPTSGNPEARAIPRAAASPIRSPVKAPGPTVTPSPSSWPNVMQDSSSTAWTMGIMASDCPRSIAAKRRATTAPSRQSAAEQAPVALSMPRIFMTYLSHGAC